MAQGREAAEQSHAGWRASLALEFAKAGGRTRLVRRQHVGPLVVQRPFYPEGDACHVYLVHPPGGIVGGDRLEMRARLGADSHALVTTPAATKFYRSESRIAQQSQHLVVDKGTLEWLPQETLFFPGAHARVGTRIDLCDQSRFVGWEIACYGRPASGLAFTTGHVAQDFELWVRGEPLLLDRLRIDGANGVLRERCGLAGFAVLGTMIAYPADASSLESARAIGSETQTLAACTNVDGALVCRAVARQVDAVRRHFAQVWCALRPRVVGREAVPPRIWST